MARIRNVLHNKANNTALLGQVREEGRCDSMALDPLICLCFVVELPNLPREPGQFDHHFALKLGASSFVDI